MPTTTLLPPYRNSDDPQDPYSQGGTPPPRGPERPPSERPRRWPLIALVTGAAVVGGLASAGLLAATGSLSSSKTIVAAPSSGSASSDTGAQGAALTGTSTAAGLDARAVYASAAPGVVDITSSGVSTAPTPDPFGQGPSQSATATGTGFVLDRNGDIATAAHVVDGASSIKVSFADGTTRTARVLGTDNATDVAVLKVDPSGLTLHPLPLGNSAALTVGDPLAIIGDPFHYTRSISTGIVSGLDRTIQAPNGFTVAHAIQTDAALNPGNSGGPVLDSRGQVIGIADQIATNGSADQSSGVGFAVPIGLVSSELAQLEAGQQVQHAYLGVATGDSASGSGVLVASVASSGPAAAAGVQSGDVITAIDGHAVRSTNELVAVIAGHSPGEKVTLTIRRGSSTRTLAVTLGTQPQSQRAATAG
jgi:putative serine protease PepD